jgi:hypothetical protein
VATSGFGGGFVPVDRRRAPRKFLFAGAQNWQTGGTSYSKTPVGAVTHVEEPSLSGIENPTVYFGLWVEEKYFAICAWNSLNTPCYQIVGDPFVVK